MVHPMAGNREDGSWNPSRAPGLHRVLRLASRVVASLVAGVLLWLLVRAVFEPWSHPSVRLVALTAPGYDGFQVPPLAFAAEDLAALEPLARTLQPKAALRQLAALDRPQAFARLTSALEQTGASDDVLILYACAHGISEAGFGYLLCANFDAARASEGRIALSELISAVSRAPARTKLLLLDAGRLRSDPRLGVLVNDFPSQLAGEVVASGDPNLWVLSATSAGEYSHVSAASERSVFGYYVEQGLRGSADLNSDGAIRLDEIHRFVSKAVGNAVRDATVGAETQTPLLLCGRPDSSGAPLPVICPAMQLPAASRSTDRRAPIAADFRRLAEGGLPTAMMPTIAASSAAVGSGLTAQLTLPAIASMPLAKLSTPAAGGSSANAAAPAGSGQPAAQSGAETGKPSESPTSGQAAKDQVGSNPESPAATANSAGSTSASAKSENTASPDSNQADASEPLAQAMIEAWQLRDEQNRAIGLRPRPVDVAPHRWRVLETRLLGLERESLAGNFANPKNLGRRLRAVVASLRRPDAAEGPEDILLAGTRRKPLDVELELGPRSLALAAAIAERNGKTLPADLATAVEKLDALAAGPAKEAFWKWVDALPASYAVYLELQWARQLRSMPDIGPRLRQEALEVCWLGERVAARCMSAQPWVASTIEAGDRMRLIAERDLLDPGSLRNERQLSSSLEQAAQDYRRAARQLEIANRAWRLEHDLLDRVVDYVRWFSLAPVGSSAPAPSSESIEQLLDGLSELVQQLRAIEPSSLERIEQLSGRLENLQAKIESDTQPAFVASLVDEGRPAPWDAGLLLSTPLATLPARLPLLAAAGRLDRPLQPAAGRTSTVPLSAAIGEQNWEAIAQAADLERRLARLAMIGCPHDLQPLEEIEARYRAAAKVSPGEVGTSAARLERWQQLAAALADFDVSLPDRILSSLGHASLRSGQRHETLEHWRWADLASRLVDPRDVVQFKDQTPAELVERAEFDALLAWQRARLLAASEQATGPRAAYLSAAAGDYFAALAADDYDVPPDTRAQPAELHVPESLDLSRIDQLATRFEVQGPRQASDVWLVVEYDPQRIAVRPAGERPLYLADRAKSGASDPLAVPRVRPLAMAGHAWQAHGAALDARPATAEGKRLFNEPASLQLGPGALGELKLVVVRRSASPHPASLVVSAWTRDRVTRQRVEVRLPKPAFVQLAVDGQAGCSAVEDGQLKLYPFPNRVTPYRLRIARVEGQVTNVSAELRQLAARPEIPIPDTAMEPDEAADLLQRLPAARRIAAAADVPLPEAERFATLVMEPAAPPPAAAAGKGKGPAQPSAAQAAPDSPPMLDNGLLLLVTDRASKRVVMRWIELMPQRPRRYIDVRADYNLAEQRVRLHLRPQPGATLPPDGCHIRWRMTGLDTGDMPGPAGELAPTDRDRVLSSSLSPQAGLATIFVDVDDYPRAFALRIRPNATTAEVSPTKLAAVRITSPAHPTAYRLPSGPIAVHFQADVPNDDLSLSDDFIEVGLDTNRDRILSDEPSVRLKADRQTSVVLDKLEPDGTLAIRTEVQDLSADIPIASLASGRAALLARVYLDGKSVWSNSVDVILDGQPPEIDRVTLKPGPTVVHGKKLDVLVAADDQGLSGVAKVEVGFDIKELGKFAEDPAPIPAVVDGSGRWAVQLPTEALTPGGYQLLVRATDRVGNASEYKAVPVRIVVPEEETAALRQVRGNVTYGKEPMPQIQITLAPEKGEKLPPVTSDERGNFVIPNVPPGKYTITAAGVVRNKKRKAEAKIEVAAPPAHLKPIALELK